MERFTELPFIMLVIAEFERLLQIVQDADIGMLVVHLWAQIAALGIFAFVLFTRRRFWQRNRVEAAIVGLDFCDSGNVQPICEYTREDGQKVRARFLFDYPSFETGYKIPVFIDKNTPAVVMTGMLDGLLVTGGMFLLLIAAAGGYQSYQMSGSLPSWLSDSLREIGMTELCLLMMCVCLWPLTLIDRNAAKKQAAELMKLPLHSYEELDSSSKRKWAFWGTMSFRMLSSVAAVAFSCWAAWIALGDLRHYIAEASVTVRVTENKVPGYADAPKPFAVQAEWKDRLGISKTLVVTYPSPLIPRQPLKTGDMVTVRLNDMDVTTPSGGYIRCRIDCGLPLVWLNFLLTLCGCATIASTGLCLWVPRKQEKLH